MRANAIATLPGSERRFLSLDEIEELCLLPFEKGQSVLEASTCWVDVHSATRRRDGSWSITGWLTSKRGVR